MAGFNMPQNFVVTNFLHVMKLLDLKRKQKSESIISLNYSLQCLTNES